MDKLANYKLDGAFSEGVSIYLDDAPDVEFKVRLPSPYNRGYTQALYGAMEWKVEEDGTVNTGGNLMSTRYAQEDAFLAHCLLSIDGEPVPSDFADTYPEAITELLGKATELANEINEKVDKTAKKSSASSSGSDSGVEKSGSTSGSKVAAV